MTHDHPPCSEPCALACPDVCALHPETAPERIVLEQALERFRREAVHGVCDTGRYRMPYYSWGEGPPLVFIHGVSDTSHGFVQPISRLSAHFRCIAYDQAGRKGDGARLARYRHEDLVNDLWALLDHLNVSRCYLMASSFGSTIALAAMRTRAERIPRAVLQGALAYRPLRRLEYFLALFGRWLPGPVKRLPFRVKVHELVNKPMFHGRDAAVWNYFLDCSGRTPIATFAKQALILNRIDMRPILPEVRQPILLLCGDRDGVIGPAHQKMLLEGLPSAGLAVIEGCGHVPSYSHPELMASAISVFLTPRFGEEKNRIIENAK